MREASQLNWKSSLALHICMSFMAHCGKVIFLRQEDVVVRQQCSEWKGWGLTAAAEVPVPGEHGPHWVLQQAQARPSLKPFFAYLIKSPILNRDMMEVSCTDLFPRWTGFSSSANFT